MKLEQPPKDCLTMGLTPGTAYNRTNLRFVGFRNEFGMVHGDKVAGYHEGEYWSADGKYKGPDQDGIVPVYENLG